MSFGEKTTWIFAAVTLCSFAIYAAILAGRAQGVPLREVAYVAPMLWTIGGGIVASVAGHAAVGCIWPKECGQKDVRDREIERFGDNVGQSFLVVGGMAALALSMARVDHFWIANAVYLGFVLSALLGSATKIAAYRKGFPPC